MEDFKFYLCLLAISILAGLASIGIAKIFNRRDRDYLPEPWDFDDAKRSERS